MNYFKLLPELTYQDVAVRNLFFKYYTISDLPARYLAKYVMRDGDTLQSIANTIYGDSELWWVLAIINKIDDIIFDLPVSQDAIQAMAKSQATTAGVLDVALFSEKYDELEILNDAKREIQVIKLDYLNRFLSDVIKLYNENK